jgi:hypothetical protein
MGFCRRAACRRPPERRALLPKAPQSGPECLASTRPTYGLLDRRDPVMPIQRLRELHHLARSADVYDDDLARGRPGASHGPTTGTTSPPRGSTARTPAARRGARRPRHEQLGAPARPARRARSEEGQQCRAGGQPAGQAIKEGVPSTARSAEHGTIKRRCARHGTGRTRLY